MAVRVNTKQTQLQASAILPELTASRDAARVQAVIRERYGFEASLQYCQHLIAFVDAMQPTIEDEEALFVTRG